MKKTNYNVSKQHLTFQRKIDKATKGWRCSNRKYFFYTNSKYNMVFLNKNNQSERKTEFKNIIAIYKIKNKQEGPRKYLLQMSIKLKTYKLIINIQF